MSDWQHSDCARPGVHGVKIFVFFMMLLTIFCHSMVMAEALQDPTRPPDYKNAHIGIGTKAAPRFVLSSTLIAPGRRLAIINGRTLAVGDEVAGAQIIAIEPARVALRDGLQEIVLDLLPQKIKRIY